MGIYRFNAHLLASDGEGGGLSWLRRINIEIAMSPFVVDKSFVYSRGSTSGRPNDWIDMVSEVYVVDIDYIPYGPSVVAEMWADVQTLTWSGGQSTILVLDISNTETLMLQLGGAPLPEFASDGDFQQVLQTVTYRGPVTSGPFGPGASIDLGEVPGNLPHENEYLRGTHFADTIYGGVGRDEIWALGGDDVIYGGPGADYIWAGDGNDTVWGGPGDDSIYTSDGNSLLAGGDGDDNIRVLGGNATVWAGDGNDTVGLSTEGTVEVWLGTGDSSLYGGTASGILGGGSGNDYISAGDPGLGMKYIWAGPGNDTIFATSADDQIGGGLGDDSIYGDDGNDLIWGADGNDYIVGDTPFAEGDRHNDTIYGGDGRDRIFGDLGNDLIYLGAGNDEGYGGPGNDRLNAGAGNDTLMGGAGADIFEFFKGQGHTVIGDFTVSQGDRLALSQWMWRAAEGQLTERQVVETFARAGVGATLVLDFGAANTTISFDGIRDWSELWRAIDII